jgi:iron(III) transport system ATP-binding protein
VLVRPEQLRLGDGAVTARVAEVSFYGHDAAVTLDLHDGPTVVARVTGLDAPEVGLEVAVSVSGRVLAFRA